MDAIGDNWPTAFPLMEISPASGWYTPDITLIKVDFPDPFSPARQ
jgi:hypothetical protein